MSEPLSRQRDRQPDIDPKRSNRAPDGTFGIASDPAAFKSPPGAEPASSPAQAAGERAIMNTVYRSGGEIVGRFASLLLFAEAGRSLGESGLGAFVFAVAFTGFVMVPAGLGLDRYILRMIAAEGSSKHSLFFNVLVLKLTLAVPLFVLSFLGLHLVGYGTEAQTTAWVLAPGVFSDSIARTQLAVFAAHERTGPPATADAINRVLSATLGILALKLGYGVVSVGVTYSIGSITGMVISFVLMTRTIGIPQRTVTGRKWLTLASTSLPFAVQEIFTTLLARVDALILTVLVTQAALGAYGAAYRLFESTLFISYALVGAFAAMFTYLGPDTAPTLRSVFQRAIKLSLVLLMPAAIAFVVLAGPICELIYGAGFASATVPLRILGPGAVAMGLATLTTSLVLSRGDPRRIASLTGIMVAVNVVLNLVLIPLYGVAGAATAMLATEVLLAASTARLARRTVGGISWLPTAVGSLAGGAAMTVVALTLRHSLPAALMAGGTAYLLVLLAVEWLASPLDVAFVANMVRRRLSSRPAA
jgi:O-antigen/teichoic acid export membrane protein